MSVETNINERSYHRRKVLSSQEIIQNSSKIIFSAQAPQRHSSEKENMQKYQ